MPALLWTASNELMPPSLSLLQAEGRQSTPPASLAHMWALLQKFIGQKTDENTLRRVTNLRLLQVASFIVIGQPKKCPKKASCQNNTPWQ